MQVVSPQPDPPESAPELQYLMRSGRSPTQYDEEFPAELSVKYDRLLQPGFADRSRHRFKTLAVTGTLLFLALALWVVHRFPELTSTFGIVLAIAAISVVLPVAFSLLGNVAAPVRHVVSNDAQKKRRDRDDPQLDARPFHSPSL
jgi:hypothetical protein